MHPRNARLLPRPQVAVTRSVALRARSGRALSPALLVRAVRSSARRQAPDSGVDALDGGGAIPSTPIARWMSFQHSFFSPGLRRR